MSVHKNQPLAVRLRFARAGITEAIRSEASLRFQLCALLCVAVALALLRVEPIWWAMVALASGAVLAAELFNTAIEHLADHLHPEIHPQIRIVKDVAAAGVLVATGASVAVALALAWHLWQRVHP